MTHLLDGNVLVALVVVDHVHHPAAARWWSATEEPFATCPITQGALIRLLMRQGLDGTTSTGVLGVLTGHARHTFWPDDVAYDAIDLSRVLGHGQVTDFYLTALARRHQARLATFDRGLARDAPDVATLIPVT